MKNIYTFFFALLFVVLSMSILSCGWKNQDSSSSNSDDNIDYAEIEEKGYKSGFEDGYGDGNEGKTYMASFNSKSIYHLLIDNDKVVPVWDKGYKKGYDDGFNEGKRNFEIQLSQVYLWK